MNPVVYKVLKKLGAISIKPSDNPNIEKRGSVELENGAMYIGQWNKKTGLREGIGTIIFDNGSLFEGEMNRDKANGFGRHIRIDGEYYVGQWEEDSVNGFGKLVNANGS